VKHYLELVLEGLPRSIAPALSSWLFRHGCWGTQEKLDFTQSNLKYEPRIAQKKFITISAYFPHTSREAIEGAMLQWLKEHCPSVKPTWKKQKSKDWLKLWKKHFKKFSIAGLEIVPAWEKSRAKKSIRLEPGMAFGTGTHATTQFALMHLGLLSTSKMKTVLDVGAGSGILSVAAERFGAKSVTALDNDPESWRECEKLFKMNKCRRCKVTQKQLPQITGQYDVVIANIIDGVLIDLKELLWKKTKKGGHLILSGILTVGASAFERNFLEGKKSLVIKSMSDEEWTSLLISK
jgi:ribosomal protein L11 methyltransferase